MPEAQPVSSTSLPSSSQRFGMPSFHTDRGVSIASREYLIAMAIKDFASELSHHMDTSKLAAVQKNLIKYAGERIIADYGDDNWCGTGRPPIPRPGPHPFEFLPDEVVLNPQPLP